MPWHEALSLQAKRALLGVAADLLAQRGTRAGLILLLRCLLPGTRVQIVNSSVDLSPVILAGEGGAGATLLPAVLLGRPHSYALLGSPHTVLGRTHLKCENEDACPRDLIEGRLLIRISAEAEDNAAVADILGYLIPRLCADRIARRPAMAHRRRGWHGPTPRRRPRARKLPAGGARPAHGDRTLVPVAAGNGPARA